MPPPTRGRPKTTGLRLGGPVVVLAIALLVAYVVLWFTAVDPVRERGSDFSASYVAATLMSHGEGANIYDQGLEHSAHLSIVPAGTRVDLPFLTPPSSALVITPLTALDPGTAFRVFSALQLLMLIASVAITATAAPWPQGVRRDIRIAIAAIAAAGAATAVMLLLGQWDGLSALGLALGYRAWRRGNPMDAVAWIALTSLIAKPHLVIGVAAFVIGRRIWREVLAGLASVAVALAVWFITVGSAGLSAYVSTLSATLDHTPPASTLGFTGLATSLFGEGHGYEIAGLVLGLIAVIVCVAVGAWSRKNPARLEVGLGVAVALSLVAAPHLLAHDLVLLAPAFVWVTARLLNHDVSPATKRVGIGAILGWWLLLNILIARDAGAGGVGFPGRLVPWALVLTAWLCWWLRDATPRRQATQPAPA